MQHSPSEIKEKLLKALDKEYNAFQFTLETIVNGFFLKLRGPCYDSVLCELELERNVKVIMSVSRPMNVWGEYEFQRVVDMAAVVEIISILERTVITKEALETTRLGKYVNELRRKTTNELLAKRAKDLVRRWRVMIQENNTTGGSAACANASVTSSAVHQTNGTNLSLHQGGNLVLSPALRSNVSPILPQHTYVTNRCFSPSGVGVSASSRCAQNITVSPTNSLPLDDTCGSPGHHFAQSSSSMDSNISPKLNPVNQVILHSPSSNSDSPVKKFQTCFLLNYDSVPKTHASNKRLRKESHCPEDSPAKKISRSNGQVTRGFDFFKACTPSQPDIHGDGSRDSISGLSQGSSSCEILPSCNKVPITEMFETTTAAAPVTTATTVVTTTSIITATTVSKTNTTTTSAATVVTSTVSTSSFLTADTTNMTTTATTTITNTSANAPSTTMTTVAPVISISSAGTTDTLVGMTAVPSVSTSVVNTFPPKSRCRKKHAKSSRVSDGTSLSKSAYVGDILKEKIASKARTPKVKTTQELVASVQGKTGSASGNVSEDILNNSNLPLSDKPSLAKCILMNWGTPADALEMSRNKTEHIAKFLQSQSELHPIQEDISIGPLVEIDDLRLQKHLGDVPSSSGLDNYNSSPAEASSMSKEILQQSSSSKDSQSASAIVMNVQDRTVEDILAQLPPIDKDAICWEDSVIENESEIPAVKEVTEEIIRKLHNEHIEGLNGNVDEGAKNDEGDNFREWHETVSKRSYQGEFFHILPYVVID